MEEELFIDIKDYEGLYKINKKGEVLNCCRNKILKYNLSGKVKRYYSIRLYKNGKQTSFSLHRLLALHFIQNDDLENKTWIDHKDRNKLNNNLDNLHWVTPSGNARNRPRNGGISFQQNNKGCQYWSACYTYYENDKQVRLLKASKNKEVLEEWLKDIKIKYP